MARRIFVSVTNRPHRITVVAALAVQVVVAAAHAASGDLDPTFGTGGKVFTAFGDFANAVALQADGKIVAAGKILNSTDFVLARYNTNGILDSSFGSGGQVTTEWEGVAVVGGANAVAVQPGDGKIVAAGTAQGSQDTDFALARYNTDGTPDTTFGTGGKVTTDFFPVFAGSDQAFALALQEDGKIVAAGIAGADPLGSLGTNWDFGLARYNPDGTLDLTFGTLGRVTTDFGNNTDNTDWAFALAQQADGKIVAAGFAAIGARNDFALARYNLDGSLDASFGSEGKVTTGFGDVGDDDAARAVALQEDGKILAAGCHICGSGGVGDVALARYNTDGTPDTTFGTGGRLITDFGGNDIVRSVALQEDGKIVAGGSSLARYTTTGALDSTFGTGGNVVTGFGIGGVALQEDGKIVAAGGSAAGNFVVARYIVEADLSLTKTGPPGRVPTGRNMTYSVSVANNGPDRALDVSVTDSLPASVSFVSVATSQGSCSEFAGTVTCTLGPIANGTTVTIEIVVRPTSAGTITNTAAVSALTPDPNEDNNTDSIGTSICRITSRRSSIPCG